MSEVMVEVRGIGTCHSVLPGWRHSFSHYLVSPHTFSLSPLWFFRYCGLKFSRSFVVALERVRGRGRCRGTGERQERGGGGGGGRGRAVSEKERSGGCVGFCDVQTMSVRGNQEAQGEARVPRGTVRPWWRRVWLLVFYRRGKAAIY